MNKQKYYVTISNDKFESAKEWCGENYGEQNFRTWQAYIVEMDDYNNCPGVVRFDFYDPQIYTMFSLKWL